MTAADSAAHTRAKSANSNSTEVYTGQPPLRSVLAPAGLAGVGAHAPVTTRRYPHFVQSAQHAIATDLHYAENAGCDVECAWQGRSRIISASNGILPGAAREGSEQFVVEL